MYQPWHETFAEDKCYALTTAKKRLKITEALIKNKKKFKNINYEFDRNLPVVFGNSKYLPFNNLYIAYNLYQIIQPKSLKMANGLSKWSERIIIWKITTCTKSKKEIPCLHARKIL